MIATHTPKYFNARVKNEAICSRIENVAEYLVCSKNVSMRKELWACPLNSANMKKTRAEIEALEDGSEVEAYLPNITDPKVKQLLLPFDGDYISVSPVPSVGLLNELFNRLREQRIHNYKHIIQPNLLALANHGEGLLSQAGFIRALRRGVFRVDKKEYKDNFVQLTANCQSMNISNGMVAIGFPAITAIGGLVHSIERKIGKDILFSIGLKKCNWKKGIEKSVAVVGKKVSNVLVTDEVKANADIVILLKTDDVNDLESIAKELKGVTRICGGSLFNENVSIIKNGMPDYASYLYDCSFNLKATNEKDVLQVALDFYASDRKEVDGKLKATGNNYTLNQTGYALLETPTERNNSRNGYKHAWVEPVFSLVAQTDMCNLAWWVRSQDEQGVFWHGINLNKGVNDE